MPQKNKTYKNVSKRSPQTYSLESLCFRLVITNTDAGGRRAERPDRGTQKHLTAKERETRGAEAAERELRAAGGEQGDPYI